MTIQAVAWVLDYSRSRAIDRLVMIAMANNDENGIVGVSKATIAREAGDISAASVWRSQKALVALGEIAPYVGDAPRWWLDLPQNKRPRLWLLCGYVEFHAGRGRAGVAQGSRSYATHPLVPKSQRKASRSATPKPGGRFRGELEEWVPDSEKSVAREGLQP